MDRETDNIVLHGPRVVLMTARKAGNTSIKTALHQAGLAENADDVYSGFEHWTAEQVASDARYRRVAILRHPVARIVSTWWHKVMQDGKADLCEHHDIPKGTSWEAFLAAVCRIPDGDADPHIRSQCYDRIWKGRYLPEIVFKLEAAEASWWPKLCDIVGPGMPETLPRENASGAPDWREHCSEADLRLLSIRYHADLWLGNYPLG